MKDKISYIEKYIKKMVSNIEKSLKKDKSLKSRRNIKKYNLNPEAKRIIKREKEYWNFKNKNK